MTHLALSHNQNRTVCGLNVSQVADGDVISATTTDCPSCMPGPPPSPPYDQEPTTREARIRELEAWRPKLIEYTRHKLDLGDWHGVADGAMDLRDLDSELDGLRY